MTPLGRDEGISLHFTLREGFQQNHSGSFTYVFPDKRVMAEFHQENLKGRERHELIICLVAKQRKVTAALELCVQARNVQISTADSI